MSADDANAPAGTNDPTTPMAALMEATQTLLTDPSALSVAEGTSYCDAAITLAAMRGGRDVVTAGEFVESVEALLCDMDDRSLSSASAWQAASLALDAARS